MGSPSKRNSILEKEKEDGLLRKNSDISKSPNSMKDTQPKLGMTPPKRRSFLKDTQSENNAPTDNP